jgi:hypothetical protein
MNAVQSGRSGSVAEKAACWSDMMAPVLIEPRDLVAVVGRFGIAAVTRLRATHCGRLDAVGGRVGRRRPSFLATHIVRAEHRPVGPLLARLARLGISAQEVAGVERDQPPEPGQCHLLDRDSLPEFECNRKLPGPRHTLVPPSWLQKATGCCRARCPLRLSRAGPLMTGYSRTGCLLSQCPRLRLRREKFGITENQSCRRFAKIFRRSSGQASAGPVFLGCAHSASPRPLNVL